MKNSSRGFTLIELLVVVALSAMLSSFAIVYSHVGQDQITLSVEAAKISQLILQAKELAISTYSGASTSCAYGFSINYPAQTYSLFTYSPALTSSGRCPSAASTTSVIASAMTIYSGGSWNVKVSPGVTLKATAPGNDVLTMVLFYPPFPTTLISRTSGASFLSPGQTSKVYLQTSNGSAAETVSVNPAGQVEFR